MIKYLAASLSIILGLGLLACDSNTTDTLGTLSETGISVDDEGNTSIDTEVLAGVLDTIPAGEINAQERAGLEFMREEEKLAYDVYVALYKDTGQNIFDNISKAEATHTASVLSLLEKYEIPDPVGSNEAGIFVDQTLQGLHDSLVASGQQSLIDALLVGVAIEEIDIIDIQTRKAQLVDNDDIALVYDSLTKGSRNHLRSFVKNLATQGVAYEPQYLSQTEYDAIINSDIERGN